MKNFWDTFRKTVALRWRVDRLFFILTAFATLTIGLMPIALTYTFKLFLDRIVFASKNPTGIVTLSILSVLAARYILETLSDLQNAYLYQYIRRMSRYKVQNYLNYSISEKISSLDIDYFENSDTQNLIKKVSDESVSRIPNYVDGIFLLISGTITLISAIIALTPFGIWLPIAAVLMSLPRIYTMRVRMDLEWNLFNRQTPDSRRLAYYSRLAQSQSPVIEARIFRFRPQVLKRIVAYQNLVLKGLVRVLKKYIRIVWIPIILDAVFVFSVIYFKLPEALTGALTIGSLVFFIQMLDQALRSTSDINAQLIQFSEDGRYIHNYYELISLPAKIIEKKPGHRFEKIAPPEIRFQNISFQYPNGTKVLKNISFSIKPGEHLAIVGPNGAGKTTLIKVLLRLYDPSKGSILINDFDLKDLRLDNWYRFVSTLFQSFQKYSLTVTENIAFNELDDPDEKKVRQAARMSGADEFIEKFPKKYEQQLGREFDGEELSVGQWQKLALARAFYEEAPVLILDEPTSAIDAEAEAQIFDNLNEVYKDKTVIFISHRFSTVRNADKIIVLKDGQIAEEGTHESLMAKNAIYARMFKKQAKGYID